MVLKSTEKIELIKFYIQFEWTYIDRMKNIKQKETNKKKNNRKYEAVTCGFVLLFGYPCTTIKRL